MKESITKFDLEAAFKALDDMETPVAEKGIRANKPALNEIFSRKSKFDALFEEYYDISNTEELSDAQENREAEIAKAKLARIEKIVDLDADSPDDLLASYVGKYIIQCPQCMTLFYKSPEDVEESEEDSDVVNINEVCQHCGNESGYTLIGKVGAADEELPEDDFASDEEDSFDLSLANDEESAEETDGEEDSEEAEEASDEDFDLSAVSLDDEETEEEDDSKEESLDTKAEGNYLLEQLNEDASEDELDISSAEFKELLDSPEFSNPISSKAAQAMLKNLDAPKATTEELEESVRVNGEELKYAVINPDGTFAGAPCTTEEEARELAAQEEGRIVVQLDEADIEALTEGGLGLLGKTLKKKLGQVGQKIKSKASNAIDKFADNTMTREEKADWVIKNTLKPDVREVAVDNEGKAIPDETDRRFDTFIVLGYKGYYSSGRTITAPPSLKNKDIVVGMAEPQDRDTYKEAESLAKGWSMDQKGGPARIFLANGKNDSSAVFLCQFFKGELDTDQDKLEALFEAAKKDLEGKAHIAKGGGIQGGDADDGNTAPKTEERPASALKVGDVIVIGKEGAEVLEIKESRLQAGSLTFKLKMADGDTDVATFNGDSKVTVVTNIETNESLAANTSELQSIMEELEELNEGALESLISNSLIETYKNVAGFRLTNCEFLNEKFTVKGKVFFESGNVRDVTYTFATALKEGKEITFNGLNEKLGADKNFTLTGKAENKTFIAESFKQIK